MEDKQNIITKVWQFYYTGFCEMTLGRTLWAIILLKLFIMFAILKLFLFPNLLNSRFNDDNARANYVGEQLTDPITKD